MIPTALLVSSLLLWTASCGYSLAGRGGSFPQGVSKVAVTPFKNRTDRYGLEANAAGAFVEQIQSTGKVKVTSRDDAEAWFEGTLLAYENKPIAYTLQRVTTERRVVISASVAFFLRGEDKPFYSDEKVVGKAEYKVTDNLVLDSESEKEAALEALNDLAQKVVSLIIEGF